MVQQLLRAEWRRAFWDGLEADPELTVTEWADAHRQLSRKSTAEHGRWRTERTPYLSEIMHDLSPAATGVRFVTFWAGAQLGKTETGNNWVGHCIDVAPAPFLIVWPDLEMARKNSRLRVDPLVEDCPRLAEKVSERKRASAANTLLYKDFPGGVLVMTGANSSSGLKSMPVRNLFMDELDDFPPEIEGQGDPEKLAMARTRTFRNTRKVYRASTCTVHGRSRIERAYQQGDQRVYEVPCPDCGVFQVLRWKRFKWDKGQPESVRYHCKGCGVGIAEHQKTAMLEGGRWRVTNPDAPANHHSYWLSSLYSPVGWYSWSDAVEEFEEADSTGNRALLQTFVTTVLAEVWRDKGEAPDWKVLYRRRERWKAGTVPQGGVFLTCGVDVQGDRLEGEVVAWGARHQSWSVDYFVLPGDPAVEPVWDALALRIATTYRHASGRTEMPIAMVAVDAGYLGSVVYLWAKTREQVMAIRGRDSLPVVVGQPTYVDVSHDGRRIARGGQLWPIGVNLIKAEIYAWLRQEAPLKRGERFPHGYCHFPLARTEEYFKQITAERIRSKRVRGYTLGEWEKVRERNEALDCRVYARAAAAIVGLDRLTPQQWVDLEAAILGAGPATTAKTAPKKPTGPRTPGWLD